MFQKIFGTSNSKVTTTNDIENYGGAVKIVESQEEKAFPLLVPDVEDKDHDPYLRFSIYLLGASSYTQFYCISKKI